MTSRYLILTGFLYVALESLVWFLASKMYVIMIGRSSGEDMVFVSYPFIFVTGIMAFSLIKILRKIEFNSSFSVLLAIFFSLLSLALILAILLIDMTGDLYRNHKDIDLLLINESPSMIIGSLLIVVVWVRYMILARKPLDFSRALRHFILGFGIILTILLIAKINKISGFEALVICYFLSGLIMLTFFPIVRESKSSSDFGLLSLRTICILITLLAICCISVIIALITLVDWIIFLGPLVTLLTSIIEQILIFVLTPFFWILTMLAQLVSVDPTVIEVSYINFIDGLSEERLESNDDNGSNVLLVWGPLLIKILMGVCFVWLVYRGLRALLRKSSQLDTEEFASLSSELSKNSHFPVPKIKNPFSLPFKSQKSVHINPVFDLYLRSISLLEQNGFVRSIYETPISYATRINQKLQQAIFLEIAQTFDQTRYGEEYPTRSELQKLEDDLEKWQKID